MRFLYIEVVLYRFLRIECVEQFVYLRCVETCERHIEFGAVKFGEQFGKFVLVPFALYFVERHIERLLALIVEVDHNAIHLGESEML